MNCCEEEVAGEKEIVGKRENIFGETKQHLQMWVDARVVSGFGRWT